MALLPQQRKATRNQIYSALFNLMKTTVIPGLGPFNKTGQRLLAWDDVPPADQPCMFMKQGQQQNQQQNMGLSQWTMTAMMWIYFRTDGAQFDQTNYPDKFINDALDAIEIKIDPFPGERQTLGGLVTNCWIDGACVFDDGLVDQQAVIVVPISILVGV